MSFPFVGWLSLAMYLLVAGGVPLPSPTLAEKDVSRPFPCMNRPCGCRSAEQCWKSCCCHSMAERLAWARAHNVEPPADLAIDASEELDLFTPRTASCCSQKAATGEQPKSIVITVQKPAHQDKNATQTINDTIAILQALSCHGSGMHWLSGTITLPPTIVNADFQLAPTGPCSPAAQSLLSMSALPPPVPPPRGSDV